MLDRQAIEAAAQARRTAEPRRREALRGLPRENLPAPDPGVVAVAGLVAVGDTRDPLPRERRAMNFTNWRHKPGPPNCSPRHVIEQYTHRVQIVRCVCGWTGSSATDRSGPSEWSRHVAEFRAGKP
jgi:hypothetical protein